MEEINSEGEAGVVSLETMIRGVCDPGKLLDLVENFTIFSEAQGEPQKLTAKNHQFLGVNNAIAAVSSIDTTFDVFDTFPAWRHLLCRGDARGSSISLDSFHGCVRFRGGLSLADSGETAA